MTETISDIRPRVLLSVQRALLGEVFPALRGVAVGWDEHTIRIACYIDGPVSPADQDGLSGVESEVMADFSEDYEVRLDALRCDEPTEMMPLQAWAYRRREK
jgi:hypothetical protein